MVVVLLLVCSCNSGSCGSRDTASGTVASERMERQADYHWQAQEPPGQEQMTRLDRSQQRAEKAARGFSSAPLRLLLEVSDDESDYCEISDATYLPSTGQVVAVASRSLRVQMNDVWSVYPMNWPSVLRQSGQGVLLLGTYGRLMRLDADGLRTESEAVLSIGMFPEFYGPRNDGKWVMGVGSQGAIRSEEGRWRLDENPDTSYWDNYGVVTMPTGTKWYTNYHSEVPQWPAYNSRTNDLFLVNRDGDLRRIPVPSEATWQEVTDVRVSEDSDTISLLSGNEAWVRLGGRWVSRRVESTSRLRSLTVDSRFGALVTDCNRLWEMAF